jgi:hypothetical protein
MRVQGWGGRVNIVEGGCPDHPPSRQHSAELPRHNYLLVCSAEYPVPSYVSAEQLMIMFEH